MPPIISVVGYSNSGKTRVATHLIEYLINQGYSVAAIKHCHEGYEMDCPGSDTDRLSRAGASVVMAISPDQQATLQKVSCDASLESVASTLGPGIDIVVAEGFKGSQSPKILVLGSDHQFMTLNNLVAVVSDSPVECGHPQYGFDQLTELAHRVRNEFLTDEVQENSVTLVVDGVEVPLKRYPTTVLQGIIKGFVSSLNGVPVEPRDIQIRIR